MVERVIKTDDFSITPHMSRLWAADDGCILGATSDRVSLAGVCTKGHGV